MSRPSSTASLRELTVTFADRTVLDRVDLVVGPQDRIAVIGDNGSGKSTLLSVLAGTVTPTSGDREVDLPGGFAVAEQGPVFAADATVSKAIDHLLHDIRTLERAITEVTGALEVAPAAELPSLLDQLSELNDVFESRGGPTLDRRLDAALDQLGLGALDRARPVAELSGGERARLSLAAALCSGADLLLLDEPTNDLDEDAVRWLERQLDTHRDALIVVTHDRSFLDRFARDIIEIRDAHLHRYGDGYRGYLRARDAERLRIRREYELWCTELARADKLVVTNALLSSEIPRSREKPGFGHGAFRARSADHGATGRIRQAKARAAQLRSAPAEVPADPLSFTPDMGGAEPADSDNPMPLVTLLPGHLELPGAVPPLYLDSTLEICPGDRWLVTGPNGAGKSTLLRVLAGELATGHRGASEELRVSWLRQTLSSVPEETTVEVFAQSTGMYPDDAEPSLGQLGLFSPEDLVRPVSELSVGQRRRLELAAAATAPGDLLLLDEPTNHLTPDLVEQLEAALVDFPGAVVTVTHDRRWLENARTQGGQRELHVSSGRVTPAD
ncbi:ABC-F family ATP-binding cassette domain-containing protein [Corynebacterium variabile]|uniref:ABC-F family ATP-binding cassette domain-containing protein n=1 Tax=Corynebacterium variabile TaxID=1727 RepID=UPI002897BCDC|nr:ABC-F family ATP-binding cassette domain-containing protein [Corynebacterium variabile]